MPLVGALESVAQLALVLGFGGLLASFGYLNPSTQIALYRLTQVFLTPVLIYFSIAFTSFRLEDVLAHWHLALYFLTLVPLVTLASWAVVRLASFSRVDCQWIAASILFQDSTCLPLTVVQALANSVMGLHLLLQGPSDTRQGVLARGVGYVAMYSLVLSILQSIFYNTPALSLVSPPFRRPHFARPPHPHPDASSAPTLAPPSTIDASSIYPLDESRQDPGPSSSESSSRHRQLFEMEVEETMDGFPPNEPWVLYDDDADNEGEGDDDGDEDPSVRATHSSPLPPPPRRPSFRRNHSLSSSSFTWFSTSRRRRQEHQQRQQGRLFTFRRRSGHGRDRLSPRTRRLLEAVDRYLDQVWRAVSGVSRVLMARLVVPLVQVFTAPVLAAILALVVGVVPALQQYIMEPTTAFHRFVVNPLEESGACAIPFILLGAGAKLYALNQERRDMQTRRATTTTTAVGVQEGSRSEEASGQNNRSIRSNNNGTLSNSALPGPLSTEGPRQILVRERLLGATGLSRRLQAMPKSLRWSQLTPMMCVLLLRNVILPLLCLGWTLLWRRLFTTPLTSDPMWCNVMVLGTMTPLVPEVVEGLPRVKRILLVRHQEGRGGTQQQQEEEGGGNDVEDIVAQEQQSRCYFLGYIVWLPALFAWLLLLSSISPVPRARVK